jgi:putative ATP-binding cassette transporter
MNYLLPLINTFRKLLVGVLVAGMLSGVSNTLLLVMLNKGLSEVSDSYNLVAASFFGLCFVVLATKIMTESLLLKLAQETTLKLRLDLCGKIVSAPFRDLEKLGSSNILVNLINDVNVLSGVIVNVPSIGINIIILISCLIYLGWLSWKMLLITMCFIVFGVFIYITLSSKARAVVREARDKHDDLYRSFREVTDGIKELKLHRRRRGYFLGTYLRAITETLKGLNIRSGVLFIVARNIGMILFFIAVGVLIFIIPDLVGFDADVLRGYTVVIMFLVGPLQAIMSTYPSILQAKVSLDKLGKLGASLVSSGIDREDVSLNIVDAKHVSLRDVVCEYNGSAENDFRLGPIDLDLYPGELVFLTGGNGSGKSTLAKVLVGLYPPKSGKITLNKQSVDDDSMDSYRQYFSVVFSDYYLFKNVKGVIKAENEQRLADVSKHFLEKFQLSEKVEVRDGEFSTIQLSMGQRKRLALLVAYLEDRPIYVFDEWAADQDPTFKRYFYTVLLKELKERGKIVFVISHDDHYYYLADRLLRLDYGKLTDITSLVSE